MKHRRLLEGDARAARAELGTLRRALPLDVQNVEVRAEAEDAEELLEMDLAFASEEPVERFFGWEELDVTPGAARLDRVAQGVCPVLANHQSGEVVGRVLSVRIGSDRVARARVRFSRSAVAKDVVQDVLDGIRQGVSFGYRVHSMELVETGDAGDRYRVTDWELFEVTVASMPADPTVGLHRDIDGETFETRVVSRKAETMKLVRALHTPTGEFVEIDENTIDGVTYVRAADPAPAAAPVVTSAPPAAAQVREWDPQPSADVIRAAERARIAAIEECGSQFGAGEELVRDAITKGYPVDQFLGELRMARAKEGLPLVPPPTDLDLSRSDRDNYSILNAVRVTLDRKAGRAVENSLELEASDEIAGRLGRTAQGFWVPWDVFGRSAWTGELEERAATGKGSGGGGALVGTDLMAGGFIDLLRNRSVLGSLGATILPGLVGDVDFPKQLTDVTTGWVAEAAGSGDSSVTFGTVSMAPKTIRSRVDMTRKMLLQSTPAVEQLARNSLAIGIAKAIDAAGTVGSGSGAEPEGVVNMTGIGAGTYTTTNGTTEFASIVELETLVAAANADGGSLAYLTTPEIRGRLKSTFRDGGSGREIFMGSAAAGELNGYRAEVTNVAALKTLGGSSNEHAILCGHWEWLYIGEWGMLDLSPDTTTLGDSGGLVLRAFQDVDIKAAHVAGFALTSVVP